MNEDQFKKLFAEFMTIPEGTDYASVVYQEVDGWDSLAHMALVAEIEDQLGIMLETDDVIDMSSFEKAKEIVARHGVAIDA